MGERVKMPSNLISSTRNVCENLGIRPNTEHWGQHFLVDKEVRDRLVERVPPMPVVEIGPGLGVLTEPLAQRDLPITAVEIDRRFEPVLQTLQKKYPHLQIVFANVLKIDFSRFAKAMGEKQIWLTGALPYQLLEPLMLKLIRRRGESEVVAGATFLISQRSAWAITKSQPPRAKLSLLAASLFNSYLVREKIGRENFWPQPRTQSAIIHLTRCSDRELVARPVDFIWRFLFAHPRARVENALREAFIVLHQVQTSITVDKRMFHRRDRRRAKARLRKFNGPVGQWEDNKGGAFLTKNRSRALVDQLGISERIRQLSVEQLDNMALEDLDQVLFANMG